TGSTARRPPKRHNTKSRSAPATTPASTTWCCRLTRPTATASPCEKNRTRRRSTNASLGTFARQTHSTRPSVGRPNGLQGDPALTSNTCNAKSDRVRRSDQRDLRPGDRIVPERRHLARSAQGIGRGASLEVPELRHAHRKPGQHSCRLVAGARRTLPALPR